jgi:hypothetical protein
MASLYQGVEDPKIIGYKPSRARSLYDSFYAGMKRARRGVAEGIYLPETRMASPEGPTIPEWLFWPRPIYETPDNPMRQALNQGTVTPERYQPLYSPQVASSSEQTETQRPVATQREQAIVPARQQVAAPQAGTAPVAPSRIEDIKRMETLRPGIIPQEEGASLFDPTTKLAERTIPVQIPGERVPPPQEKSTYDELTDILKQSKTSSMLGNVAGMAANIAAYQGIKQVEPKRTPPPPRRDIPYQSPVEGFYNRTAENIGQSAAGATGELGRQGAAELIPGVVAQSQEMLKQLGGEAADKEMQAMIQHAAMQGASDSEWANIVTMLAHEHNKAKHANDMMKAQAYAGMLDGIQSFLERMNKDMTDHEMMLAKMKVLKGKEPERQIDALFQGLFSRQSDETA